MLSRIYLIRHGKTEGNRNHWYYGSTDLPLTEEGAGEIEASPGEDHTGSVCRYCEYRAVCRAGTQKGRERDGEITYQDIAGKNTLRESEKQRIMTKEKTP